MATREGQEQEMESRLFSRWQPREASSIGPKKRTDTCLEGITGRLSHKENWFVAQSVVKFMSSKTGPNQANITRSPMVAH